MPEFPEPRCSPPNNARPSALPVRRQPTEHEQALRLIVNMMVLGAVEQVPGERPDGAKVFKTPKVLFMNSNFASAWRRYLADVWGKYPEDYTGPVAVEIPEGGSFLSLTDGMVIVEDPKAYQPFVLGEAK